MLEYYEQPFVENNKAIAPNTQGTIIDKTKWTEGNPKKDIEKII